MSEDDFIFWQDHLDFILSGRVENMPKCPFCSQGNIKVTRNDYKVRLQCEQCRHYIEGRFPDHQIPDLDGPQLPKSAIKKDTADKDPVK